MAPRYFISTLGDVEELTPVSLPPISLPDTDEIEIRERAKSFAEKRLVKSGQEAWDSIAIANTFSNWRKIGLALLVGKTHAMRITGANRAAGRNYSHALHKWVVAHGFTHMRKSDRSHAIQLAENLDKIEAWRQTLPEKRRRRLKSAQAVTKAWRKSNESPSPRLEDKLKAAEKAWRRFIECVEALPPHKAAIFRQRISPCAPSTESQFTSPLPVSP